MILEKEKVVTESSTEFASGQFGIDEEDMGFVLGILRNKIYSDPIGSIAREILSNCRDANREAGKGDVAPIVTISQKNEMFNSSSLSISFEDNGPGISPDRMFSVFLKYGKSTKRADNSQTGGFGMGCKTPFAYTDAFTIITKVDGVKYFYSAIIDETLKGKIVCLQEQETTEPNGTTIVIPIKDSDRYSFENGIIKASTFWEVRPTIKNFQSNYPTIVKVYESPTLFICERLYGSNAVLNIDGIMYPVNNAPYSADYTTVYLFKNGDLSLSVNRETVQYDEKTNAVLKEAYKGFEEFVEAKVYDFITQDNDLIKQINRCHRIIKSNSYGLPDEAKMKFYKSFLSSIPSGRIQLLDAWQKCNSFYNLSSFKSSTSVQTCIVPKGLYLVDTNKRGQILAIPSGSKILFPKLIRKPIFKIEKQEDKDYLNTFAVQEAEYKRLTTLQAAEIESIVEVYDPILVSTLAPLKVVKEKSAIINIPFYSTAAKDLSSTKLFTSYFDFEKVSKTITNKTPEILKNIYVVYDEKPRSYKTQQFIFTLYKAIAIEQDLSIVIINKRFKSYFNFKPAEQLITDYPTDVQQMLDHCYINNSDFEHLNKDIKWNDKGIEDALKIVGNNYSLKLRMHSFLSNAGIEYMNDKLKINVSPSVKDTVKKLQTIYDTYPMLKLISTKYFSGDQIKIINQYIKEKQQ